jgi:hypothetical protein
MVKGGFPFRLIFRDDHTDGMSQNAWEPSFLAATQNEVSKQACLSVPVGTNKNMLAADIHGLLCMTCLSCLQMYSLMPECHVASVCAE